MLHFLLTPLVATMGHAIGFLTRGRAQGKLHWAKTGLAVAGLMATGVVVVAEPYQPYASLDHLEQSLYQKQYSQQPLEQRLTRLETSLMGQIARPQQSLAHRLQQLQQRFGQLRQEEQQQDIQRTLTYMEQRLYSQAYPQLTPADRLTQIEQTLFGLASPTSPVTNRMARVTQAMPVAVKKVTLYPSTERAPTNLSPVPLPGPHTASAPNPVAWKMTTPYNDSAFGPSALEQQVPVYQSQPDTGPNMVQRVEVHTRQTTGWKGPAEADSSISPTATAYPSALAVQVTLGERVRQWTQQFWKTVSSKSTLPEERPATQYLLHHSQGAVAPTPLQR